MSHSRSAKSSSSSPPKADVTNSEQNCKVYVSNIHRDVREQEIREIFQKFGEITYFAMKRKPEDIIYAFIEYKTHQQANEAVEKMNRTSLYKRTLNVQFGRGGKHQQQHYETISIVPLRNREFEGRRRQDRQRRSQQSRQRYQIQRKSDRMTRRGSRSPPNDDRSRRQYRNERPKEEYRSHHRSENEKIREQHHDFRRRPFQERQYRRDERKYPQNSPRRERKPYDQGRKHDDKRYDDKKRYDQRERDLDPYKRREKSQYQQFQKRDRNRYDDERPRRIPDDYQRNRDIYREQRHHRTDKPQRQRERSPSSTKDKFSRSHRDEQRRTQDERSRYPERRQRPEYLREGERERKRRSRSRDKSPHKHKSHRRDRDDYDDDRREKSRYQRQYPRGARSPRSPPRRDDQKRRRNSRSPSPYRKDELSRFPERNPTINFSHRNEQYRRYHNPHHVRNFRPEEVNRDFSRVKGSDVSNAYRKNSRVSRESKSMSPEKQPRQNDSDSDKKPRFSSERDSIPRANGQNYGQIQLENQMQ